MASLSNFPTQIDNFIERRDIGFNDLADINRYNVLKAKGSGLTTAERNEFNAITAKLRATLFIADDMNFLQDAVVAVQTFTRDRVDSYIDLSLQSIQSQNTSWQTQMTNQKNQFDAKMGEINSWYASIQANLATIVGFDFDNIPVTPDVEYIWTDLSLSTVTETIKYKATVNSGRTIATRVTTFGTDLNNITVRERVYNVSGTLVRDRTMTMNLAETPTGRIISVTSNI